MMRRFTFLAAIGVLATLAGNPFAHASDRARIVCVANGGVRSNGDWLIEGRAAILDTLYPSRCVSVSDEARPNRAPEWIGSTPPEAAVNLYSRVADTSFSCGNGGMRLSGRIYLALPDGQGYSTEFQSTTFTDGVADVTGTGDSVFYGRTRRTVSGTIIIDDGAGINQCDDTWPNARVLLDLTLSD